MNAQDQITHASEELRLAQKLISELQETVQCEHAGTSGFRLWHKLETIDDRIHEALVAIGG